MTPVSRSHFFKSPDGKPDGGQCVGIGFAIVWQRGSISENGRNGAFLVDVLKACQDQLEEWEGGEFDCEENATARSHVDAAIKVLEFRRDRRAQQGILGEHTADPVV